MGAPTEEEFEGWITPAAALDSLPANVHHQIKRRTLMGRLQSGALIAYARQGGIVGDPLFEFPIVASAMFQLWHDEGSEDFWALGDAKFTRIRGDNSGYGMTKTVYRFHDVRLDPAKFPTVGAAAPRITSPGSPNDAHMQQWYNALLPDEKMMGIRQLWAKAKADHPNQHVLRKQIEPFVAGRKRGPRTSR